ncbi:TM2 domain-containing protein [Paenibacillus elgii]
MDYNAPQNQEKSSKSFVGTLLLAFFFGSLGMHRFYAGKVGTAILMIFTLGGFGIWTLIDFIMIAVGRFTDSEGKLIKN